jgi:hypothetical protein
MRSARKMPSSTSGSDLIGVFAHVAIVTYDSTHDVERQNRGPAAPFFADGYIHNCDEFGIDVSR